MLANQDFSVFFRAGRIPPAMGKAFFRSTKPVRGGVMSDGCDRAFLCANRVVPCWFQAIAGGRAGGVVAVIASALSGHEIGNSQLAAAAGAPPDAARESPRLLGLSCHSRKPESTRSSKIPTGQTRLAHGTELG